MKLDPPKESWIIEDQRPRVLKQDQVIMFGGTECRRLDQELAAHSEVQAEPQLRRELKEQLLASTFRVRENRPWQLPL
jgi:hypothetical protein